MGVGVEALRGHGVHTANFELSSDANPGLRGAPLRLSLFVPLCYCLSDAQREGTGTVRALSRLTQRSE